MMRMLPYRTADNVINGVVLTFTDITRISAAEQQIARLTSDLRSRIAELETLLEIVPVGVIISEAPDASHPVINAYGARLIGQADRQRGLVPITAPFRLFEGNGALEPNNEPLRRSARLGEVVPAWEGRLRTSAGRDVHVMISATPLFSESQGVRGAIAAIIDMSAHKRAEEQQLLLLHELQHRVKNILATIASLAVRMAQRDRLAGGAWSGTRLSMLVEAALGPYIDATKSNVQMTGPDVRLDANTASTLGMALHELATNAAKYGSLSVPSGTADIVWGQSDDAKLGRRLHLTWTERDGPPVHPSAKPGFGTAFITRAAEYDLQGRANVELLPAGLRGTLEFPIADNLPQPDE
jgi:two-component system, chemotaxis family, CheB/CheR fusion protein